MQIEGRPFQKEQTGAGHTCVIFSVVVAVVVGMMGERLE